MSQYSDILTDKEHNATKVIPTHKQWGKPGTKSNISQNGEKKILLLLNMHTHDKCVVELCELLLKRSDCHHSD